MLYSENADTTNASALMPFEFLRVHLKGEMHRHARVAKRISLMLCMMFLLTGMAAVLIKPAAAVTTYIRANGSVEPSTAPIQVSGNTYTLTGNITDSLVVEANNIVIDGANFALQGPGGIFGTTALRLSGRNSVTIKNLKVANFYKGIVLSGSSNNNIDGVEMTGLTLDAIGFDSSSNYNNISSSTLIGNYRGISLIDSSNNTISGNYLTNLMSSITISQSSSNIISGNNIASDLSYGTSLVGSTYCSFYGNNITGSSAYHDISLVDSDYNSFYGNNILGNGVQSLNSTNVWDGGYASGGNFWSDYIGTDSNGDGLGDTPYVIDASNQDQYPLMSTFQEEYALTVNAVGSGSVTKNPDQSTYGHGVAVTLTATPAAGWSFTTWSDDASGNTTPITINMIGNKLVTATFTQIPQGQYTLTIDIVGSGTVSKTPDLASYVNGTTVSLTATPAYGWSFSGWSGALSGSTTTETIIITSDKLVTATFQILNTPPYQPQLSITPILDVKDNDDLVVSVVGPTPPDQDGDSVTYTYRWLVDSGTGSFVDDEAAGRGDHPGNTVPSANTNVGDIWRVEVKPTDEHSLSGTLVTANWQIVTEDKKPIANAGSDQTVNEDTRVTFDGSASTDDVGIANYVWVFMDGTLQTLTGKNPSYIFATPGAYTVTLNVTDAAGNWATDTVVITVSRVTQTDGTGQQTTETGAAKPDGTKPVANAGADKLAVEGNVVTFDAGDSSDSVGIVSYEWDFGDKTTGTGRTITHTYNESGTFTVTLTVKDAAGNSQTNSITVTVQKDTDKDGTPDVTDTDDDNDGMPDAWETDNGLNPLDAQDAGIDSDHDGLTSLQEYLQGKDPNASEIGTQPQSLYVVAVAVGAIAAATMAILVNLGGLVKNFDSTISKLPLPEKVKEFIQLYGEKLFEAVDKVKLETLEKGPFIARGEIAAFAVSGLMAIIVFGSAEARGLQNFLTPSGLVSFVPSALVSVCVVILVGELFEALIARACNIYRQFRLWMYGTIAFLVSGLLFQLPFGSPGTTRYQSGEISKKTKGLLVLSKMLFLMALAIPFAGLSMIGFDNIGSMGLKLTLMTVFFSLLPLRPLVGKAIFDYRKEISLTALMGAGILFFSCAINLVPDVTYLAAGVASAFLAGITLYQLRKAN